MKNVQSLRNAVMVSLFAGTTLVWGGTAFAQEDLQEFALEDMVVTASRVPTQKVDTPADISVITKEERVSPKSCGMRSNVCVVRL